MSGPVQVFPGLILARLSRLCTEHATRFLGAKGVDNVLMSHHQSNGMHCVHQASARLSGDETLYRVIVAPADAPLQLYGRPIDEAFAKPLADWPEDTFTSEEQA